MKGFKKFLLNDIDHVDETADNLAQSIGATDDNYKTPELKELTESIDLANLLIPAMNGDNKEDASELTAILLYMGQKEEFDLISKLMMKVSLVEMWHYSLLQEAIVKLGGKINSKFTNRQATNLGSTPIEALKIAIDSETQTIANYKAILKKLENYGNKNAEILYQLIFKLLKDEELHLKMFEDQLSTHSVSTSKILKISIENVK